MKTPKLTVAALLVAASAATTAVAASSTDTRTTAVPTPTQTIDNRKKCKTGYRYSRTLMRCVKKRYRGSH